MVSKRTSVYPVLPKHERQQVPEQRVAGDVTRALSLSVANAQVAVVDNAFLVCHTCEKPAIRTVRRGERGERGGSAGAYL